MLDLILPPYIYAVRYPCYHYLMSSYTRYLRLEPVRVFLAAHHQYTGTS